jgi:hypothetical protein
VFQKKDVILKSGTHEIREIHDWWFRIKQEEETENTEEMHYEIAAG